MERSSLVSETYILYERGIGHIRAQQVSFCGVYCNFLPLATSALAPRSSNRLGSVSPARMDSVRLENTELSGRRSLGGRGGPERLKYGAARVPSRNSSSLNTSSSFSVWGLVCSCRVGFGTWLSCSESLCCRRGYVSRLIEDVVLFEEISLLSVFAVS